MKMPISCWALYLSFISPVSEKTNDCVVPAVPPPYNVITASIIIVITFILAITVAARYLPRHGECSFFFKKVSLIIFFFQEGADGVSM